MQIFDNIGCSFISENNENIVILGPLNGYNSLSVNHIGYTIPYLLRSVNNKNILWEIGVAKIDTQNNKMVLKDRNVISSSNNNQSVLFDNIGKQEFYIFVNSANFNTGFNNVNIVNSNFTIPNQKTTYIIDASSGYLIGTLPNNNEALPSLEIEFRLVTDGVVQIVSPDKKFSLRLDSQNYYSKIIYTGNEWVKLIENFSADAVSSQSTSDTASILSDPSGEDRSIQYNNAGVFDATSVYYGNNEKILFGSVNESEAKHVVPSSGDFDTLFNQTQDTSNFVVHGKYAGNNYPSKNLIFTYDGKLGLNMPSGISPATVVHIINNSCSEDMRLENKASDDVCNNPAHLALYKNPYILSNSDDKQIGKISFSAKNGSGLRTTYGHISAKTKSLADSKGQLDFTVKNNTTEDVTISTSPDSTTISHSSGVFSLSSSSGNISVPGSTISLNDNNTLLIKSSGTASSVTVASNAISMEGSVTITSGLRLPYINQSDVLLSVDSSQRLVATTGFKIPGIDGENNKVLTTTSDGTVVANYDVDSFWPYETGSNKFGGKDLIWDRYEPRTATTCLTKATREIELSEYASISEFSVGDQIQIKSQSETIYRNIDEIITSGDFITGLVIDENIIASGDLDIFSVTKGGVLTNTIFTSGVVSDASAVTISTRPQTPTVFNTTRKNIDFEVYGVESQPTFAVIANASTEPRNLGIYYDYATQLNFSDDKGIPPIPSKIQSNGFGVAGDYNTANFQFAAGEDIGSWAGMVSAVGTNGRKTYYQTYDQNGNVYEWIEDEEKILSSTTEQYICGGSWRTLDPIGLRSYIPTPRTSGFDDIGFRICSKAGFIDTDINSSLAFNFVRVDDPNNLPDSKPLFTESFDNRFGLSAEPQPLIKNNLGVVDYSYLILDKEINNLQYVSFLNAVASIGEISGLYKEQMATDPVGGIERSGSGTIQDPFVYSVKSGMDNMPVVFVDYISVIRFINWLENGAPTGDDVTSGVTENGAYSIIENAGVIYITKNSKSRYWLPSLNEWHKAAYYRPLLGSTGLTNISAITIKRDAPFEYELGKISSVSIQGDLYSDSLSIGPTGSKLLDVRSSDNNFNILIGPDDAVVEEDTNDLFAGVYRSYISNTGIVLATSGTTSFINKINPLSVIRMSPTGTYFYNTDIYLSSGIDDGGIKISPTGGIEYIDSSGNIVPGGMFPGTSGGFLFKASDNQVVSSDFLKSKEVIISSEDTDGNIIESTGLYPILEGTSQGQIIHNSLNGSYLSASSWFGVGLAPSVAEDLGNNYVGIYKPSLNSGELPPILYTDRIFVGPPLAGYEGSILTHNGTSPASWKQPDYLSAPGLYWNRYPRRAVEFLVDTDSDSTDRIKFISLDASKGGTGPITIEDIELEFAVNETIAIYNQDREVLYVKVANISLVDSRSETNPDFFTKEEDLLVTVCPEIPSTFYETSDLELGDEDPDSGRLVGYAFSVQKGAYMEMYVEPGATAGFSCEAGLTEDSEYRFKPSTVNTISIRPTVHTSFNTIGEDIDFVVYGNRKTLFTRYESSLFSPDSEGLPGGLIPALRVHAAIENSYLGSIESGIYRSTYELDDAGQQTAITGVKLDTTAKITINRSEPYPITRINDVYEAVISPINDDPAAHLALEEAYGFVIPATGLRINSSKPVSTYADLSVNGFTYTSGLISEQIALSPIWTGSVPVPYEEYESNNKIYVPNYPLTINNYGQIVSLIPPPSPELPGAPTNLIAQPRYNSAILSWDAPSSNGGKTIFAYVVEMYDDSSNSWTSIEQLNGDLPVDPNPFRYRYITGLNPTISYSFRVYAVNEVGRSSPSEESSPVQPDQNYPDSPLNFSVTRGSYEADLSWEANPNVGSDPINGYIVKYAVENTTLSWKSTNVIDAETFSTTIANIQPGPTYYFRITAVSDYGESLPIEIKSIGTDTPVEPEENNNNVLADSFDFSGGPSGLGMMFTGVCY